MATKFTTKQKLQELNTTPVQPAQAFGTTKTIDEQWKELYKSCRCTQEAALYADCRINKKMTIEQARDWMAANFTYKEVIITPEDMHRASVRNKLKRIKNIQNLNGMTPLWAEEVYKEARELGILNEKLEIIKKPLESSTSTEPKTKEECLKGLI